MSVKPCAAGQRRRAPRSAARPASIDASSAGLRGARRARSWSLTKRFRDPHGIRRGSSRNRRPIETIAGGQRWSAPPSRRSRRAGVRAGTIRRRRPAGPRRAGRDRRATRPAAPVPTAKPMPLDGDRASADGERRRSSRATSPARWFQPSAAMRTGCGASRYSSERQRRRLDRPPRSGGPRRGPRRCRSRTEVHQSRCPAARRQG